MIAVVVPVCFLLLVVLWKKFPLIGGNINAALLLTGVLTLLLGAVFNPADWIAAWIDGLNRMAWIMALSITGGIFAEISVQLGTVDTIIGALTAKFRNHPRILVVCILATLTLAGSLLGDAIAAATVVGILTFGILVSMNLENEKIAAIVMMGASVGSIMPPMTQALALSSSLIGTDPDPVISIGYITVSICFVVVAIYGAMILIQKDNVPGANKEIEIKFDSDSASDILKRNWKSLIPLCFLIVVIFLRTLKIVDVGPVILQNINFLKISEEQTVNMYQLLSGISIVSGLTNGIVLSIICAIAFSFLFKKVRENSGQIFRQSLTNVQRTLILQICCSFMLGSFYKSGAIETVGAFAQSLNGNILKLGGTGAMCLLGMLTGSQSTTQNVVFTFFGPALVAFGVDPTKAAVAGAHLAAAGQGMPPADLTTFVICGMISSQFGKKVDPVKSMFYSLPMCIVFLITGIVFLYM